MSKFNKLTSKMYLFIIIFFINFLFVNAQSEKHEHEDTDHHLKKENQEVKHDAHEHDHDAYEKCFVALHGVMLFQGMSFLEEEERFENQNGSPKEWNSSASIPTFSVGMGYKFSKRTEFFAKAEFEYGGFGGHQHLHEHGDEANIGLEKSGAVTIERVYLTHKFSESFKLRMGHMPIPMGQVYLAHEPTAYMASINAKADSKIIPGEWQETGISIFGKLSHQFDYQFMCVTGLDADYFEPYNFVSGGKQSRFEKIYFTSPALVGRIDYNINNLKLGLVGYWGSTDHNAQDQQHEGRNINVALLEFDTRYRTNKWHFLANIITGNATNTEKLDEPIAQSALSGSVELGFNLNHNESIFNNHENALWLFGRIDYSNPMMNMPPNR
ncbi:MAG: hypothetical protein CR986_03290 [Ignavibacteriae bacterium]|nr:MAG: hypothetical protein CR986_03290 [Ignavibacteriota bacterium]